MMFKKIDHIEILPGDMERSLAFYTSILGFRIKERLKVDAAPLKEVVYLELGNTILELLGVENPAPAPNAPWQIGYRMMALEITNMDETLAYLKKNGVEPTWGPVVLGPSKRAEIKDPDGLSIELRQW